MKKVLFVCLISLSMCLSVPAGQQDTPQQAATPTVAPTPTHVDNATATVAPATDAHPAATATNATSKTPTEKNTPAPPSPTSTSDKSTAATPADKKDTDGNKTDANKVDPTKDKSNATNVTPAPTVPANATVHPDDKGKSTTTTPKVPTSSLKPSDAPSKEGEKVPLQARGFDGASFIGGIILTLGLLAIGFMGFKYYKNQTERNYHTL